jgi:microcystin degradation protein MlrC
MALLQERFRTTISYRKIPLVTPCECFRTAEPPLKNWFDLARQFEEQPGVMDVSLFPVFPWMDAPELGWSVVVVTDNHQALADDISTQLANHAWAHRREFFVKKFEPAEAVRRAAASPTGPVVIADGADATNGGSPGDSTCLLREMLIQRITCPALLTVVDPEAVDLAYSAGIGQTVTLHLGAKRSRRYHQPVNVTAHIVRFSNGQFDITGHGAMHINMGRCALLEIGSIKILVSEYAGPGHDPQVFRHIGVEPAEAQIVVVKSTVGHMDAYRDMMQENLPCECPGPSPSYLERLDYRRIPRPMFPFDQDMEWQAA